MTSGEADPSWFLAQLRPNCAQMAKRNLERQQLATFLPFEEETHVRHQKFVSVNRPLFPGYIFAAVDVATAPWRAINATQGISRLVSFGNTPALVPNGFVESLKQRCDADGKLVTSSQAFNVGDTVQIVRGALARFVGEIERIEPDRRVWLLMEIMGGRTRLALPDTVVRLVV